MALMDLMATHASGVFAAAGGFAETVTVNPPDGGPYPILAQVFREAAENAFKGQRPTKAKILIGVVNDPVLGVPMSEVTAAWTITVALRYGDTATPHAISLPPANSDNAMLMLWLI